MTDAEFSSAIKNDLAKWNLVLMKLIFQWTGLWPEDQHNLIVAFGYGIVANFTLAVLGQLWFLIEAEKDTSTALVTISITMPMIQSCVKLFTLVVYKKQFQQIIATIWFHFLPITATTKSTRKEIYFTASFNRWMIYIIFVIFCAASSQFLDFFLFLGKQTLPFFAPFSGHSPIYELVYVWEWVLGATVACSSLGSDCLFFTLTLICITQFQIINSNLELMGTVNAGEKIHFVGNRQVTKNNLDHQLLNRYVKQHIILIRTCFSLAQIFQFVILIQLLFTGVTICLTGFLMIKTPNQITRWLLIAMVECIQLSCYCFFGHELTLHAENCSNAAYKAAWCDITDLQLQKALVFIIQIANKEISLTAGGFTKVNRNLLVQVFKFSMSVYTLLGKVIDREQIED